MRSGIDFEGAIRFAKELASTPSISGTEQAAVELTARELEKLGFDHVCIDRIGNCVGYLGSKTGPKLLIDGHIDSIPLHSEEKWSVDPFGGEIRRGRLYGLGICDQKASIAAAAYGLAAARDAGTLSGQVALVASINEEDIEGAALAEVVEQFQPTWAITTEPSDTHLCIGQRGRAKLSASVTGRACHAGHAGQGVNAAEALAELITAVRHLDHPHHPLLGRRDITCIDVASTPYPSVSTIPGRALARFDCRFLPGETAASLIETISQAATEAWSSWSEHPVLDLSIVNAEFRTWRGEKFTLPEFEHAWWTPEDSLLVERARAALRTVGLDDTPRHYSFCTNGSHLSGQCSIPTVGFGVGEEHVAHQVDEYVTLDSLRSGAMGFAAIASHLVGAS